MTAPDRAVSTVQPSQSFHLPDGLAVLERTPATFRALLSGLSESWIATNEGPNTFSPFDNVGHLIHGERADWIPRARIILAQAVSRRFEPYDRFAQVRESEGKSLAELLDAFARLRSENVTTLRSWNFTDHDLALTGEHHREAVGPWRAYLPVLDR